MKKCSNCQKETDAKFCPNCGTEMDETETSAENVGTQEKIEKANSTEATSQNHADERLGSKTWFVVLLLFLFWPIGLFLMWSRKKFTKVARIIITVALAFLVLISAFTVGSYDYTTISYDTNNEVEEDYDSDYENEVVEEEEETPTPADTSTVGEKNALSKAYDYLDYTAFSYTGLIEQLEYEGFTNAESTYAANKCGADWNEQASAKAQDYIDYSSFSRQSLIDQLLYEGFTQAQAEYGVKAVGY